MTKPKTSTTAAPPSATIVPAAIPHKGDLQGHPAPLAGGGAAAKTNTAPPPPAQAPNNAQHNAHNKKPSHAGGSHKSVLGHSVVSPPEAHHDHLNNNIHAEQTQTHTSHVAASSHASKTKAHEKADGKSHRTAHTFEWKQGGGVVKVTGTFDNWTGSVVMKRVPGNQGRFESIVNLDRTQKVLFKFIVDGEWKCIDGIETEYDQSGNLNNVLRAI